MKDNYDTLDLVRGVLTCQGTLDMVSFDIICWWQEQGFIKFVCIIISCRNFQGTWEVQEPSTGGIRSSVDPGLINESEVIILEGRSALISSVPHLEFALICNYLLSLLFLICYFGRLKVKGGS